MTARANQYKRNRRYDVWVLVGLLVLLLADPAWLRTFEAARENPPAETHTGDQ